MTEKILNYIGDNFSKKTALLCGFVCIFTFFVTIDGFLEKFVPRTSYRSVLYVGACLVWLLFWLYKRNHLPRNKKGYVGIVICVATENDKQKNRLKNDFVKRIRELVSQKNLKNVINIILLSNYQVEFATKILDEYAKNRENKGAVEEWQKIRKRTRGHFFIYGTIKERQDGENRYFLDLEALVTHAPVQFSAQKQIVQDFLSVWYKQISFQEKIEFKGFLFAADTVFIAVQFVVGIAALVSGDLRLALELHASLDKDPYFSKFSQLPPNLLNVKRKIKTLLAEENFLIAKAFSKQEVWGEAEDYLERSLVLEPNYGAYLLKSIVEFSVKNNPAEALKAVYQAKNLARSEETWRYNEGFLLMYLERFEEALKVYREIALTSYPGEEMALAEIYKFNQVFLIKHPEKIQSYFIIGYLKFKKELNYPDGLVNMEKFLDSIGTQEKYDLLRAEAEKCQRELKRFMQLQ